MKCLVCEGGEFLDALHTLALRFGPSEALFLLQLLRDIAQEGIEEDGQRWVQRTYADLHDKMSWMTQRSIERTATKCRGSGVLLVRSEKGRKANWYSVSCEALGFDPATTTKCRKYTPPSISSPSEDKPTSGELETPEKGTSPSEKGNEEEVSPSKKGKNPSKPAPEYYDHEFYEEKLGEGGWDRIRNGWIPENETRRTLLIAAFLCVVWAAHHYRIQLRGSSLNGKLARTTKYCLEHFVAKHDGDELAGLNEALDYIRWWVTQEDDPWLRKHRYNHALLFSESGYISGWESRGERIVQPRSSLELNRHVKVIAPEDRTLDTGIRL